MFGIGPNLGNWTVVRVRTIFTVVTVVPEETEVTVIPLIALPKVDNSV